MAPAPLTVSKAQARRYLLRYHFLSPPRSLSGAEGVQAVMDRLRCIQVDPLDVAGKNVDLVLQSRVAGYRPELLEEPLYGRHRYVETWDKLRSVVPREDWHGLSAFRERMKARHRETGNPPEEVISYVREELARRGELTSLDLEDKGEADWRWAPARAVRAALEIMFDWGEIGISGRQGGRKVYTPMLRLLADPDQGVAGDRDTYLRWHVERRVGAVGLIAERSGDSWLGVDKLTAAEREHHLAALVEVGALIPLRIEGIRATLYIPAEAGPLLKDVRQESPPSSPDDSERPAGGAGERPAAEPRNDGAPRAASIAPLDNLLWDRRFIEELFGFSYRWEVYKPAAERQYGYYVLPVIHGDRFIARWEPRRESGRLAIRGWWWEPGVDPTPTTLEAAREMIARFASFLGVAPPAEGEIESSL